VKSTTTK